MANPQKQPAIKPIPFPGESPTVALAMAAGEKFGLHEEEQRPVKKSPKKSAKKPAKKPAKKAKAKGLTTPKRAARSTGKAKPARRKTAAR